ncbi:S46 family peptidase [Pseudoflavitalea sp. G-6-1-2]|uniref:S46 family peptidase n=1 Tax=Pseudoflavitalea sp. G-6-1-2 TaxID=2728841 RepID=UPI00146EFBCE|nr:S46 family peptidase [Pseudoflavitalea sp. G-6-1-2]NML20186.1 S46 family peptidase [Pseudoflavitalea sp. G-6-1-2]
MKKFLVTIVLCMSLFRSMADEGMWLPMLLGQQVYNDMVKRGLKLTKEQLYSVNKASIKDAIIIFGGFCTGEIVSNEGLIFTNHHCGYDAIASASTVAANYLKEGFWAKTKQQEIPSPGLYADFLIKIDDVTKEVEEALKGLTGTERLSKQNAIIAEINARYSDVSKNIIGKISPMFKGNQFLMFVYQRFNDIRLVGAPPESIGKFGGDTDNWEWPRHTGDFSVFRVYSGKDGANADYSPNNVPLKPKHFLPVSIKGIKDGDYSMIYGYPGSTNRYESSYGVKQKIDIANPTVVNLRDMRLKYMLEEMKKDPATRLKLASDYASIANYWKFFDGESKQLIKYNVLGQKQAAEAKFQQWANGKPEFANIFSDWGKVYDAWRPYSKHQIYLNEGVFGSPLLGFAASLQQVENAIVKKGSSADIAKAVEAAKEARAELLKSENTVSDQKIVGTVLQLFYNDIDKSQHPIGFFESVKGNYGSLDDDATWKKYAASVFSNTMILNDAKWDAFTKNPDGSVLQADPAYATASAFVKNWQGKYLPLAQQFNSKNAELGRLYLKGVLEMDPVKAKKMYPDATFTMRVSFGNVKSYAPADAVKYDYITTMKGILEKYKPGDYEFDLPAKLLELAKKKDYGQYADPVRKDLVIGFITTNDITGGNSGSPVIDANGNLIGLAFDGNYEALSHKIQFDPVYNRTICVDIRYVLWCIDKLGGATNLINELKLVK